MRRFLALALLALLLSLPLASSGPRPPAAVRTGQPYVAAPSTSLTIEVESTGYVRLTVEARAGDANALRVDGPSDCSDTPFRAAEPGATLSFDCGLVAQGRYAVALHSNGLVSVGRWRVYGASIVPA